MRSFVSRKTLSLCSLSSVVRSCSSEGGTSPHLNSLIQMHPLMLLPLAMSPPSPQLSCEEILHELILSPKGQESTVPGQSLLSLPASSCGVDCPESGISQCQKTDSAFAELQAMEEKYKTEAETAEAWRKNRDYYYDLWRHMCGKNHGIKEQNQKARRRYEKHVEHLTGQVNRFANRLFHAKFDKSNMEKKLKTKRSQIQYLQDNYGACIREKNQLGDALKKQKKTCIAIGKRYREAEREVKSLSVEKQMNRETADLYARRWREAKADKDKEQQLRVALEEQVFALKEERASLLDQMETMQKTFTKMVPFFAS